MRLFSVGTFATLLFTGILFAQNGGLQITTPSPLPNATVGVPYRLTFQATGSTLPLSWGIVSNGPPGLSLDDPSGILSGTPTAAGTYTFGVNVVSLSAPETVADSTTRSFTLTVAAPGSIRVSPTAVTFNAFSGGEAPPAQALSVVVSSGTSSNFTFTVDGGATGTTAPWLTVQPATGGGTPGRLLVSADPTKVQGSASSVNGRIRVLASGTTTPVDVAVKLVLTVAPAKLAVSPGSLRFNTLNPEQILVVHNAGGGGPLNVSATVNGNNSFITSVTPSGVTPAAIHVRVNPGSPGAYRDSIHVTSSAGSADIPVSFYVPSPGPVLAVSKTGFRIQTSQGLGTSTTQFIRILNEGDTGTTLNWKAELLSGGEWLSLTNDSGGSPSGTATRASHGALFVKTGPGAAAQTAGGHYALIRISAPGAQNSPQYVVGVLDVAPAGAATAPDPTTGGLFFVGAAGGTQPAAQLLEIGTSSATPVKIAIASSTLDGAPWLSIGTVNDSASSAQTAQYAVSAVTAGLKPGIYKGEIDVAIQNELRVINVTLAVAPAGTTLLPAFGKTAVRGAACTGTQLALTETGMVNNFNIPAGWPATLEMQLNDDCGTPILNGTVVASFSNGDPPLTLLGDGLTGSYSATWQPGAASSSMAVSLDAAAPGLAAASTQLTGGVNANATPAPSLVINGLLHNLNPQVGAPLAPGTVTQVYGTNLTAAPDAPTAVPLPVLFKGVQVFVGGLSAPLYYVSPTQLTIQIPSELTAPNEYQALIAVDNAYTLPQPVDLVPVAPGVVAFLNGDLVAQHSSDYSLVDAAKPAKPGEALIIYLVGLGATSDAVASGAAAPGDKLITTSSPVTVTIDGQPAQTFFTGLTPGGVGLYQINLTVPANAKAGKLPVVITQAGVAANATTLLVQP